MFTFYWEIKFSIGQSGKIFSVKTGFEELKKSKQILSNIWDWKFQLRHISDVLIYTCATEDIFKILGRFFLFGSLWFLLVLCFVSAILYCQAQDKMHKEKTLFTKVSLLLTNYVRSSWACTIEACRGLHLKCWVQHPIMCIF